jgi:hypothetical protein
MIATAIKSAVSGVFNRARNGLPPGIEKFTGAWRCVYTAHARRSAGCDRYGAFDLPQSIRVANQHVVEAEFVAGRCVKAVVRFQHNDSYDLVLVVCDPMDGEVLVKTAWLNRREDSHTEADRLKFDPRAVAFGPGHRLFATA